MSRARAGSAGGLAGRLVLWLVLAALPPGGAVAAARLGPGDVAPAFDLPGRQADQHLALAALRGKPVLLGFWASWCPSCQQLFDFLNDLQSRQGALGLQVVGVALDARRNDAEAFLQQHPPLFPVVFDPAVRVPRDYTVEEMPTLVLVGADGHVRLVHAGFTPSEQSGLERELRAALAAKR